MTQTMLRWLPLAVVAATFAFVYAHYQQFSKLKKTTFETLVLETQQQARAPFKRLFDPVTRNLLITKHWLQEETVHLDDVADLNSRLMPVLREVPQISSALVANSNGSEYMLLRTGDGWLTRSLDASQSPVKARWARWKHPGQPIERWEETLEYDTRTRPWFRGAVDSGDTLEIFWTPAYRFFTTRELGITASSRVDQADHADKYTVIAFDVRLIDIVILTRQLLSDSSGKAFVFSGSGQKLAVPGDPEIIEQADAESLDLAPVETYPDIVVRQAYKVWQNHGRPGDTAFEFSADGTAWWASMRQHRLSNRVLWLAIAVPEAELVERLGGISHTTPLTVGATGLVLFLASLLFARRQRTETAVSNDTMNAFFNQSGTGSDNLQAATIKLIQSGENEQLEFKSSVRWNFKAGRPGKEIELAWLKTAVAFLNSEGGVILLGVDDQGQCLGLKNDGFANNDKALRHIENLIAQHIGPAHFPRIHSRILTLDGKQVLIIACEKTHRPVFLKHDKGEDFYIRTGPASRALATSEALTYIENRKAQQP